MLENDLILYNINKSKSVCRCMNNLILFTSCSNVAVDTYNISLYHIIIRNHRCKRPKTDRIMPSHFLGEDDEWRWTLRNGVFFSTPSLDSLDINMNHSVRFSGSRLQGRRATFFFLDRNPKCSLNVLQSSANYRIGEPLPPL